MKRTLLKISWILGLTIGCITLQGCWPEFVAAIFGGGRAATIVAESATLAEGAEVVAEAATATEGAPVVAIIGNPEAVAAAERAGSLGAGDLEIAEGVSEIEEAQLVRRLRSLQGLTTPPELDERILADIHASMLPQETLGGGSAALAGATGLGGLTLGYTIAEHRQRQKQARCNVLGRQLHDARLVEDNFDEINRLSNAIERDCLGVK